MSNKRTRKAVVYKCDKPGCKISHTAPYTDFKLAWANAKAAGWVAAKVGETFVHFCSWVHRPSNDEQLADMFPHLVAKK